MKGRVKKILALALSSLLFIGAGNNMQVFAATKIVSGSIGGYAVSGTLVMGTSSSTASTSFAHAGGTRYAGTILYYKANGKLYTAAAYAQST